MSTVVNGEGIHGDVHKERSDFRNVGRKLYADRLLEVVGDETTFFDAVDDGREVVIHMDHIGSFLGNILTGDTHSNADVTLLEGRGVVDTVPPVTATFRRRYSFQR